MSQCIVMKWTIHNFVSTKKFKFKLQVEHNLPLAKTNSDMGVSLKFFLLVSVDKNIEWADAVQERKKGYAGRDLSNDVTNFLLDLLFILFRGLSVLWLLRFASLGRVRVDILPRWGSIFLRDVLVLLSQKVLCNLSFGFFQLSMFLKLFIKKWLWFYIVTPSFYFSIFRQ